MDLNDKKHQFFDDVPRWILALLAIGMLAFMAYGATQITPFEMQSMF